MCNCMYMCISSISNRNIELKSKAQVKPIQMNSIHVTS